MKLHVLRNQMLQVKYCMIFLFLWLGIQNAWHSLSGSRESCYSYVYLDCKRKNVVEIVKGYI